MSHRFTTAEEAEFEGAEGRNHYWHSKPGFTDTADLLVVRCVIEPGQGHAFHYHPNKEEVIYFISGEAEQWIGKEKRLMGPGSSVYIPADVVHATFNRSATPIEFVAIITPASAEGPITVDLGENPPP